MASRPPKLSLPVGLAAFVASLPGTTQATPTPEDLTPATVTGTFDSYKSVLGWTVPVNVNRAKLAARSMGAALK